MARDWRVLYDKVPTKRRRKIEKLVKKDLARMAKKRPARSGRRQSNSVG